MSGLYLDSSALTKLVIHDLDSEAVEVLVLDRPIFASRVAVVEVAKAVARHDPGVDPSVLFERTSWVELDPDIASAAGAIGGARLRALDAIHISSALLVRSEIDAFVTYDRRQAEAAEAAGLRVLSPTGDPG
ncbi:MAG: PIN domain-containing protein [Chloroflexi bacterium]|nr:PIN domain-containing protein [Chloroflexota bacterium]